MLKVYDLSSNHILLTQKQFCYREHQHMLIFWQIAAITKEYFQNIQRKFHELLFQKYSKHTPGIMQGYENVFMKAKCSKNCFVCYHVKFLILAVSFLEMLSELY